MRLWKVVARAVEKYQLMLGSSVFSRPAWMRNVLEKYSAGWFSLNGLCSSSQ